MPKTAKTSEKSRAAQGRGSVYQDKKSGYWIAQVQDGYKDRGRPNYHRLKRKTEQEAVRALTDLLHKKEMGKLIVTATLTTGAWLDQWLEQYVKPNNKPKTYSLYEGIVRRWIKPHLGKIALKNLRAADIDRLIAMGKRGQLSVGKLDASGNETKAPLSPDSLRLIRAVLRRALTVAVRKEKLGENPVLRTDPPKMSTREVTQLSSAEVAKLLDKCQSNHYGSLIIFVLHTGLRIGEALGLTWSNVDLENEQVRITNQLQRHDGSFGLVDLKTGSKARRSLALPAMAVDALTKLKNNPSVKPANSLDLVFTSYTGAPIHARTVDAELKQLCFECGIQVVSFHKLRHTVATRMAEAGVALDVIRDQLGHSQIALTANTYRGFVPAKQKEAANTLAALYTQASKNSKSEI